MVMNRMKTVVDMVCKVRAAKYIFKYKLAFHLTTALILQVSFNNCNTLLAFSRSLPIPTMCFLILPAIPSIDSNFSLR